MIVNRKDDFMKKTLISFATLLILLIIPISSKASFLEPYLYKTVQTNDRIVDVVTDRQREYSYVITQKRNFEQQLIAISSTGQELWRYDLPKRTDYRIFIHTTGDIIVHNTKAERMRPDGYNPIGNEIFVMAPFGERKAHIETSLEQYIDEIFVTIEGEVFGYSARGVYKIDLEKERIVPLKTISPDENYKGHKIYQAAIVEDFLRITMRNSLDNYSYEDYSFDGTLLKRQQLEPPYRVAQLHVTPLGNIHADHNSFYDYEGNITTELSWRNLYDYRTSNLLFDILQVKDQNRWMPSLRVYNRLTHSVDQVYLFSSNEQKPYTSMILDEYHRLIYLTDNGLIRTNLQTKEHERYYLKRPLYNDYSIGGYYSDNRIILYDDKTLYFVSLINEPMIEWVDVPDEKITNPFKEWTIVFNEPLSSGALTREHIFVAADKEGKYRYPFHLHVAEDRQSVTIRPTQQWYRGDDYYLFIREEVAEQGGKHLPKNYRMKFTSE